MREARDYFKVGFIVFLWLLLNFIFCLGLLRFFFMFNVSESIADPIILVLMIFSLTISGGYLDRFTHIRDD